jgi:hypothetical protein
MFRYGQMYYMFGFIMLAFLVLLIVCAQTSILLCYFHLCSEDYRWWWRSFFSTGTTAFYLFLFSIYYFVYKTTITGSLSYILFFGYTFIVVFLFFLMSGKRRGGREGGRGGREGGRRGKGEGKLGSIPCTYRRILFGSTHTWWRCGRPVEGARMGYYTFWICLIANGVYVYSLSAGSIGFLSCLLFVRKIYSIIKID